MKLTVLKASERFTVLDFGCGRECESTDYQCSKCGEITVFTSKDFSQNILNPNLVLDAKLIAEIENVRPIKPSDWEANFDFKCHECNQPIRVIHSPNEFRMACHNFLLKEVVEIKQNENT